MTKAEEKRLHILRSANQLLIEKGLDDFTIDEVAKKSGYSKGGVTYYFSNKDELLVSLSQLLDQEYLRRVEEASLADAGQVGNWTRALIEISDQDLKASTQINNALIAGAMVSQQTAQNVTDSFKVIQERVANDGYDQVLATIIRLAIDGLYYSELFNASPINDELRGAVLKRVKSWTYQALEDEINN